MPRPRFTRSVTTRERIGENDAGVMQHRVTVLPGSAFIEYTPREVFASQGALPAGSGFVAIEPEGYGERWALKPGDEVIVDGSTRIVLAVNVVKHPRTGVIVHIEVSLG